MSKVYELWDGATRNLVGAYETEAEALSFVQTYVVQHGNAYPESWILLWDNDETDSGAEIAAGSELVARALGQFPDERRRIPA